jgi:ribosomal protein S17
VTRQIKPLLLKLSGVSCIQCIKKIIKRSKRFAAHDEANKHQTGDIVRIRECAPKSKRKTWEVVDLAVAK